MVVFASLHRHWTAPAVAAAVGVRKRSNSALPARSLGKGKELVAEKPARGEADPFAEFKSVLGEDEGFEAPYDPLRQGPLRYVLFDRGSSYGLSRTLTDSHGLVRTLLTVGRLLHFQVSRVLKRGWGGIQSLAVPRRRSPELCVRWLIAPVNTVT